MHDDIKEQIEEQLFTKTGKVNSAILRRDWFKVSNLYRSIIELTFFLDFKNPKFTERIWCIMNDITLHPKCVVCNDVASFSPSVGVGYFKTCKKQSCKSTASAEKAIETKIKKYGSKVSPKTRESARNRVDILNKKGRETLKERYGVDNPSQIYDHRFKVKKTLKERYGVEHPSQIQEVIYKRKENVIDFYQELSKDFVEVKNHETTKSGCDRIIFVCNECNEEYDIPSETFKWRCRNNLTPCPSCSPIKEGSNHQLQIAQFLMELIPDKEIVLNNKSILKGRREIDIFIPDMNLGIEYNGVYWHSFNRVETKEERNLHLEKTKECENKNIRLIHIFENEWLNKNEIVKSRLSSILGKNNTLFARKCKIKEIDNKKSKELLEKWHIQGYCPSNKTFILEYQNDPVSIMTFGKSRFGNYEWELLRFASKNFINVVGGAQKLLSHFIKTNNPNNIVSYADRRWSFINDNLYLNFGFEMVNISKPSYFYYKKEEGMILYNRIKFQKHKLSNLLEIFNPDLTESQNMFNNGYRRVWDCGNLVFQWNK